MMSEEVVALVQALRDDRTWLRRRASKLEAELALARAEVLELREVLARLHAKNSVAAELISEVLTGRD